MQRDIFDQYSPLQLENFMFKALQQAEIALTKGEVPVGAVLVHKTRIIAKTHNQVEELNDPTAHAELLAISSAASHYNTRNLQDCILFVTLEPCAMCAGATFWSRVGGIAYGASDPKRGMLAVGRQILHPKTFLRKGILEEECGALLKRFFGTIRS